MDSWAKKHDIDWMYLTPYHPEASGKIERYNELLRLLRTLCAGA